MAAARNTIVTHHADGTSSTEVVDWTAEETAAHVAAAAIAWKYNNMGRCYRSN